MPDQDLDPRRDKRSLESPEEREQRRQEENALIRACQQGHLGAFEALVTRYEKKVYWIAYNLVGAPDDAQDLAQEAFLRVFKAIGRFKLQYNFYTWLYRIVVNLSIDHLRKKGKHAGVSIEESGTELASEDGPERAARNHELGERIRATLDALPSKYKAVIVLRDVEQMPCHEIAKIINCTNATTRWRLHKAREMFKERWERQTVAAH